MAHPPLDAEQVAKALAAYHAAREQAWRYVLGAVDPSAYNAPALPIVEVLTRVQGLVAEELARYAAPPAATPGDEEPAPAATQESSHAPLSD